MRAHFLLREQCIGPGLQAVRTLVVRPLQGCGNTAPLSYPHTWARKPDYLHLAYRTVILWLWRGWVSLRLTPKCSDAFHVAFRGTLASTPQKAPRWLWNRGLPTSAPCPRLWRAVDPSFRECRGTHSEDLSEFPSPGTQRRMLQCLRAAVNYVFQLHSNSVRSGMLFFFHR